MCLRIAKLNDSNGAAAPKRSRAQDRGKSLLEPNYLKMTQNTTRIGGRLRSPLERIDWLLTKRSEKTLPGRQPKKFQQAFKCFCLMTDYCLKKQMEDLVAAQPSLEAHREGGVDFKSLVPALSIWR